MFQVCGICDGICVRNKYSLTLAIFYEFYLKILWKIYTTLIPTTIKGFENFHILFLFCINLIKKLCSIQCSLHTARMTMGDCSEKWKIVEILAEFHLFRQIFKNNRWLEKWWEFTTWSEIYKWTPSFRECEKKSKPYFYEFSKVKYSLCLFSFSAKISRRFCFKWKWMYSYYYTRFPHFRSFCAERIEWTREKRGRRLQFLRNNFHQKYSLPFIFSLFYFFSRFNREEWIPFGIVFSFLFHLPHAVPIFVSLLLVYSRVYKFMRKISKIIFLFKRFQIVLNLIYRESWEKTWAYFRIQVCLKKP